MSDQNRYVTFGSYFPTGSIPAGGLHVSAAEKPVAGPGEVLLRPTAIAIDPFQRNLLTGRPHHAFENHVPGKPISGFAVAEIVESNHPDFAQGEAVTGWMDWADYAIWPNANKKVALERVDRNIEKPDLVLSVLGITGLTAYYGIVEVAKVRPGETIVISSAAGGVGSLAGQMAKILGGRVIGLTSSTEKRSLLTDELGFDVALDYRAPDFADQLKEAVPGGPDIYLDNVGGALTTTIMWQMKRPARIVECGQLSTYEDPDKAWTVNTDPIHANGLRYEGYQPMIFKEDWDQALSQMQQWMTDGKLKPVETRLYGLDSVPDAMRGLFTGANSGKIMVVPNGG